MDWIGRGLVGIGCPIGFARLVVLEILTRFALASMQGEPPPASILALGVVQEPSLAGVRGVYSLVGVPSEAFLAGLHLIGASVHNEAFLAGLHLVGGVDSLVGAPSGVPSSAAAARRWMRLLLAI